MLYFVMYRLHTLTLLILRHSHIHSYIKFSWNSPEWSIQFGICRNLDVHQRIRACHDFLYESTCIYSQFFSPQSHYYIRFCKRLYNTIKCIVNIIIITTLFNILNINIQIFISSMNRKTINNTHNVNLYLCICVFVEDAWLDDWWAVVPAGLLMELSGPQSGRDFRVGRHSVCVTCLGNIIASTKFVPICLSALLSFRFLAFCLISFWFRFVCLFVFVYFYMVYKLYMLVVFV